MMAKTRRGRKEVSSFTECMRSCSSTACTYLLPLLLTSVKAHIRRDRRRWPPAPAAQGAPPSTSTGSVPAPASTGRTGPLPGPPPAPRQLHHLHWPPPAPWPRAPCHHLTLARPPGLHHHWPEPREGEAAHLPHHAQPGPPDSSLHMLQLRTSGLQLRCSATALLPRPSIFTYI